MRVDGVGADEVLMTRPAEMPATLAAAHGVTAVGALYDSTAATREHRVTFLQLTLHVQLQAVVAVVDLTLVHETADT